MSDYGVASSRDEAGWSRALLLFCILFIIIAMPAFFRLLAINSEELVSYFGAAYGMRLFYPAQNRILSVLPVLTSWLGTPQSIAFGHLFIAMISPSLAVAFFAKYLPRAIFYLFSVFLILAVMAFFNFERYHFHLISANPYLVPFSLGLISCTLLLKGRPQGLVGKTSFYAFVALLVFAGAGINPSSTLLSATVLGLYLATLLVARLMPVSPRRIVSETIGVVRDNRQVSFGMLLNCLATLFIFWLSGWYQARFPQYVMSNYSVPSYVGSGISLNKLFGSFVYLTEFNALGGSLGVTVSSVLVVLACLSGLASGALFYLRRQINPAVSRYYLAAFIMWLGALLVLVVISQNAHVQLSQSLIQGRYYSISIYVFLLSSCSTGAAAVVDFARGLSLVSKSFADRAWLLTSTALVVALCSLLVAKNGHPTTDFLPRNTQFAKKIEDLGAQAILGNYWLVWVAQYDLNWNVAHTPAITPVTIRTETFGLNVFKPVTTALAQSKKFRFVCLELTNPPQGFEGPCQPQIEAYQAKGAFPLGETHEISKVELGTYKLTLYEMGLRNSADPADCTASNVLMRAKSVPSTVPGQDSYMLEEDSFVYLQRPEARADWVLRFTQDGREEVVIVPRTGQSYFHLLDHRISVTGTGCRLLVALSRRDQLFPNTMKLDVR